MICNQPAAGSSPIPKEYKDLGANLSPFLCPWGTGGAIQNNCSQKATTKKPFLIRQTGQIKPIRALATILCPP